MSPGWLRTKWLGSAMLNEARFSKSPDWNSDSANTNVGARSTGSNSVRCDQLRHGVVVAQVLYEIGVGHEAE